MIERVQAHYEVQDLEMGKVYGWRPESAVVECEECGELVALMASQKTCGECVADYGAILGEEGLEARPEDDVEHPWRSLHPYYLPTRGT